MKLYTQRIITMATLIRASLFRFAVPGLFVSIVLGACTKPEQVQPEQPRPTARYELTNVRYFLSAGDRIDTVAVALTGYSVQNPKATLDSQQVENSFDELIKTSQFNVMRPEALPKDIDLSTITAKVPQYWNGGDSFNYFEEEFPIVATQQQKPYGGFTHKLMPVRIPPKSKIDVSRQVDAYQLTCSFEAVLKNTTTGQQYPLAGKWKGLLRYNNVSITLTQQPLP